MSYPYWLVVLGYLCERGGVGEKEGGRESVCECHTIFISIVIKGQTRGANAGGREREREGERERERERKCLCVCERESE